MYYYTKLDIVISIIVIERFKNIFFSYIITKVNDAVPFWNSKLRKYKFLS